jgi:hypothetical protein
MADGNGMARALHIVACALALCALTAPAALADPPSVSVTLAGTIEQTHTDTASGPDAITFLSTAAGPQAVTFAADQPVPPNGAEVELTGRVADGTLAVSSATVTGPTIVVPTKNASEGNGAALADNQGTPLRSGAARRVAIVVITFAGGSATAPTYSDATLHGVLEANANSVSNYFNEQSYGAVSFTGNSNAAGDIYRVSIASNGSGCNDDGTVQHAPAWMTWGSQAAAAVGNGTGGPLAQNRYGQYTNYDHVIYVFNSQHTCGWAGLGYMPGDEVYIDNAFTLSVVAHELGHNLGVHHASTLRCVAGGLNVAFSSTNGACTSDEYGDMYDIMGQSSTNQQNAFHKLQSGWLGSSTGPRVQTITTSGSYTVGPLESSSGLDAYADLGDTFALDFRQPTGSYFDNYASNSPAIGGVQIRLVQTPGDGSPIQTQLIDTTPQTSSFADAALTQNSTFVDSTDGITIQTTDVNPLGATVHVTFGATGGPSSGGAGPTPAADTTAPSAVSSLSATVASGPVVTLAFAAATDDRGVSSYRITRDGSQIDNLSGALTSFADWTAPYGSHSYGITAVDTSGNVGPTATVSAIVSPPVPPKPSTTPGKKPATPGPSTPANKLKAHTVKVTVKIASRRSAGSKALKRRVTLTWKRVAGAKTYTVTRNGRRLTTTKTPKLVDASPPRGTLRYTVTVT